MGGIPTHASTFKGTIPVSPWKQTFASSPSAANNVTTSPLFNSIPSTVIDLAMVHNNPSLVAIPCIAMFNFVITSSFSSFNRCSSLEREVTLLVKFSLSLISLFSRSLFLFNESLAADSVSSNCINRLCVGVSITLSCLLLLLSSPPLLSSSNTDSFERNLSLASVSTITLALSDSFSVSTS